MVTKSSKCTFLDNQLFFILHSSLPPPRPSERQRQPPPSSLVSTASIRQVLQHPRCQPEEQRCRVELAWAPSHSSCFCCLRSPPSVSTQTPSHSTLRPLASSTRAHGRLATTFGCRSVGPRHSPSSGAVNIHRLQSLAADIPCLVLTALVAALTIVSAIHQELASVSREGFKAMSRPYSSHLITIPLLHHHSQIQTGWYLPSRASEAAIINCSCLGFPSTM